MFAVTMLLKHAVLSAMERVGPSKQIFKLDARLTDFAFLKFSEAKQARIEYKAVLNELLG